jgi:hypothetical protein
MPDDTDPRRDAAEQERQMEEHERAAREREPDERSPDERAGEGDRPAPPGNVEQPRG